MTDTPLDGAAILVTRPEGQADGLCRLIEQAGGEAVRFPALAIRPPRDTEAVDHALMDLRDYDLAIFISPNAVRFALLLAQAHGGLPAGPVLAAVGRGTAAALRAQGYRDVLCPAARFDSEGLLALPELQEVRGRRVMIFRGEGGRERLAQGLRERGAEVDHAEVYRRVRPDTDPGPLWQRLEQGRLDLLTATSVDGLQNLLELAGERGRVALLGLPLIVVSERMAEAARELGFLRPPVVAAGAGDEALMEAIGKGRWRTAEEGQG